MAQLGEYVKMALKNIWANKIRTLLTMLGIIIGISSVIMIMAIGGGATEKITKELGRLGKGQIQFYLMDHQDKYFMTKDEMDEIREMEGVKALATQEFLEGSIKTKRDDFKASIFALDYDGFTFLNESFLKGGSFSKKDAEEGKSVCVIREQDAMRMFGSTNVIGMDIDLSVMLAGEREMTATIVGVTATEENSMVAGLFEDEPVRVIIPPETFAKTIGIDFSKDIYEFFVLAEDDMDAKILCDEIIEYLEVKHHCKGKEVYAYQSFDDIMKTVNSVINMITLFVAFVASVSLLVGGIGVMNIMLVSVTERTREIGIRKALGAKTGSITVQFLAESAFITLIGGLIGILLGVLGAWIVAGGIGMLSPNMKFSPALKLSTIVIASAFSSFVGIFFGIYPARKAAKMNPIEALRRN